MRRRFRAQHERVGAEQIVGKVDGAQSVDVDAFAVGIILSSGQNNARRLARRRFLFKRKIQLLNGFSCLLLVGALFRSSDRLVDAEP